MGRRHAIIWTIVGLVLNYSIPNALVYRSKYVFQILWKIRSSDILFKAS